MAFGDLVQTAKATGNEATNAVGVTATFGVTPTVGNLITVHAYSTVASVTFTTDLSSALALGSVAADAGGMLDGFYKIAAASQPTAIKVFPSVTADISIIICEWAGPFAAAPLDVESPGTSSVSTAVTSQNTGTTPTTGQPSELAVAAIGVGLHLTDITGWSNSFVEANEQQGPATSNRATIAVARRVLTATGTYTTAVTHGSGRSRGMLATFRQSSAPVSGTLASTQEAQTMVASGSTVGGIIGALAATQQDQTMVASGTVEGIDYPGGLPSAAIIALYDARLLAGSAGAAVSSWPDSGPLAQAPLAQGSSSLRPVLNDSGFGGIRAVQFDGVDDRLEMALASTYTDDFAFVVVCELLTYPTGSAALIMSTASIPNKHLIGVDDVEDPPGWVTMSSNDGTQAQHHHGTASQTYLEAVPSRFIITQLVRNDGEHKFWENSSLVINLADSSGENSDLNNLTALKLGCREDNSRHGNSRIAYVLVVDMTETDETTLLAARNEVAYAFAVPGFASSHVGTLASTQTAQTMVATGTVRKLASGGSTDTTNVLTDGGGRKSAKGGTTEIIQVDASGAGLESSRSGSVSVLAVATDGGGRKTARGGSTDLTNVDATGGGQASAEGMGGSVAFVYVVVQSEGREQSVGGGVSVLTADGLAGGRKTGRKGSTDFTNVDTSGAGRKTGRGGATDLVGADTLTLGRKTARQGSTDLNNVLTDGGGRKTVLRGSTDFTTVDTSGNGRKSVKGGATELVTVDTQGHGLPGGGAGSFALVDANGLGGGRKTARKGSTDVTNVATDGGGRKTARKGSTDVTTVNTEGGGYAVAEGEGGSTEIIAVDSSGSGRKRGRQGSVSIISVDATGAGEGESGSGSLAIVTIASLGGATKRSTGYAVAEISVSTFGKGAVGIVYPVDPGAGLMDIHGLVVKALRADIEIAALVGNRVFARRYPDRVDLPALRVDFPNSTAVPRPTLQWHRYDGQVAVHARTQIEGKSVAKEVQKALLRLEGNSFPEGWVAAVDPFGVWSGFDAEWTPPKPHWVVSVLVTASGP